MTIPIWRYIQYSIIIITLWGGESLAKKPEISETRLKTGPVYRPPVEYKGKIYFLSSEGVLWESNDPELKKKTNLFKTENTTISGLVVSDGVAYFGDGFHDAKKSYVYGYSLKEKKLLFKKSYSGHFEKTPVIYKENIIVSAGPEGLISLNKKTGKENWQTLKDGSKKLHIDSTPLIRGMKIYVTSIYDHKALLGIDVKTGKVLWSFKTKKSPKSDVAWYKGKLIVFATEAKALDTDRKKDSDLLIVDPFKTKESQIRNFRGHNLFDPVISDGKILLGMSTGDILRYDISSGRIDYFNLVPEPIRASTFSWNNSLCSASALGKIMCFRGTEMVYDKSFKEVIVGQVGPPIDGKVYLPTRYGFFVLKK